MVSKKDINNYDFRNIDDYYEYILKSYNNGQHLQVENLINKLSTSQKKDFLNYLDSCGWPVQYRQALKVKTLQLL